MLPRVVSVALESCATPMPTGHSPGCTGSQGYIALPAPAATGCAPDARLQTESNVLFPDTHCIHDGHQDAQSGRRTGLQPALACHGFHGSRSPLCISACIPFAAEVALRCEVGGIRWPSASEQLDNIVGRTAESDASGEYALRDGYRRKDVGPAHVEGEMGQNL